MSSLTSDEKPCKEIIIFGGTGDLTSRKLLPALYLVHAHDKLHSDCRIVCVGRQDWQRRDYIRFVEQSSRPYIDEPDLEEKAWHGFLARIDYVCMDVSDLESYQRLRESCSSGSVKVFYLATSPTLFIRICQGLGQAQLIDADSRLVLEKPLGHDLLSAKDINASVARYFDEHQIYRIDHYLGKETVQNLMVLRFGNAIFEPIWRAPHIRQVQITVAETVGVGSRAGFYDQTGAMRDMIQNHLLQLLCIVAMESPLSLEPDDVRDEKLKVLRALPRMDVLGARQHTVRGQYSPGSLGHEAVKGYLQEDNVSAGSQTETFVAIRTQVNNARWAGVPFFLRTGKRLQQRRSQIVIDFAQPVFSIFADQPASAQPNRLVINLQPEESIELQMMAKEPGSGMNLKPVRLNLDLESAIVGRRAEAYERLLIDVIKGRLTHFMRRDELEAAWKWVDPIVAGWGQLGEKPRPYAPGTWGPAAASALMAREGGTWFEES